MHYSYLIPAVFAAGALAAPFPQPQNVVYAVVTDVVTAYTEVDVYADAPDAPAAAAAVATPVANGLAAYTPAAAQVTTAPQGYGGYEGGYGSWPLHHSTPAYQPAPAPTTVAQAPAQTSPASAPTSGYGSGSSDGSPMSGGVSILTTMNKWRSAYGLALFTWDEQLAANALKTGQDNHGVTENHQLNSGSMCQVISPGINSIQSDRNMDNLTPFEMTYLAGWLCERPESYALGGNCKTWTGLAGMQFPMGETGHADILTGNDLKVGCAFVPNSKVDENKAEWSGLWTCDLA